MSLSEPVATEKNSAKVFSPFFFFFINLTTLRNFSSHSVNFEDVTSFGKILKKLNANFGKILRKEKIF